MSALAWSYTMFGIMVGVSLGQSVGLYASTRRWKTAVETWKTAYTAAATSSKYQADLLGTALATGPLPMVGLPWTHTDSEGNLLRIAVADDDQNALIISTSWTDKTPPAGHRLITCAALETYQARRAAASAILTGRCVDAAAAAAR